MLDLFPSLLLMFTVYQRSSREMNIQAFNDWHYEIDIQKKERNLENYDILYSPLKDKNWIIQIKQWLFLGADEMKTTGKNSFLFKKEKNE